MISHKTLFILLFYFMFFSMPFLAVCGFGMSLADNLSQSLLLWFIALFSIRGGFAVAWDLISVFTKWHEDQLGGYPDEQKGKRNDWCS